MPPLELVSPFTAAGYQPEAIEALATGVERGDRYQTLLGITGSGKSFTIAGAIARAQRPTLVLAPNKSLAAQLASEFREFFPKNRVEYFVSYYDYYQPEAYVPSTDTYIEKDSSINDEIDRMCSVDALTGEIVEELDRFVLFPASHYVTDEEHMQRAIAGIEAELADRLAWFEQKGKLLEAQRLRMRTTYDLEMLREIGVCNGIENYSRFLDGRSAGQMPYTLLDYFPDDFLCILDESHVTVPQLHGQYEGDRSRKETLVEHGFRLPSALDNRPLRFNEFIEHVNQVVFMSATPGDYEIETSKQVVEQIVRPTGLVDPEVIVKPTKGQIDDLVAEINARAEAEQRVLVTTLTKKMAEDLTDYLIELGMRVRYMHSEIDTLERVEILRALRLGEFDVLVGINLLREGLDLPEVSLVAILDADKEGFLRSDTSLIQTIGRAARH